MQPNSNSRKSVASLCICRAIPKRPNENSPKNEDVLVSKRTKTSSRSISYRVISIMSNWICSCYILVSAINSERAANGQSKTSCWQPTRLGLMGFAATFLSVHSCHTFHSPHSHQNYCLFKLFLCVCIFYLLLVRRIRKTTTVRKTEAVFLLLDVVLIARNMLSHRTMRCPVLSLLRDHRLAGLTYAVQSILKMVKNTKYYDTLGKVRNNTTPNSIQSRGDCKGKSLTVSFSLPENTKK